MKLAAHKNVLRFALRIAWRAALALVLLVAGALAYLSFAFDPNGLKPKIAAWMQSNYQRQLTIAGDIRLKWWPSAHLEVSGVSLSQPNSAAPFASLRRGLVTLRLGPLLRKQVSVDALMLEGLSLDLQRFADGRWSIDDLLDRQGNSTLQIDVASLVLRDASLNVHDMASGRHWRVSDLQITAGPIALEKPGEMTASLALVDDLAGARVNLSITSKYLARAQAGAFEASSLDVRVSGQVSDVAVEQLQLSAGSLRHAGENWELRDARLTGRGMRGPEQLALQADCTQFGYTGEQWRAGGIRAQLTRELPQTEKQLLAKQQLNLSLDALQGSAKEVTAPASKLAFSSQDVLGTWSGQLLGAGAYQLHSGAWRLSNANADATWQGDAGTQLHLIGTGEVSALPVQGIWRAEDFAFTLTGALPLGQVSATGRARASAEVPTQRFVLALDPMQLALRNKTLLVEAKNTKPVTVDLVNDALTGALHAAQIRVRDTDLDLAGTLNLALAGTRLGSAYTFRPFALNLSGKRAGVGMKTELRGEVNMNAQEQRLSVPNLQANAQFDSTASGTVQLRRAALRGALTVDGRKQRLRFETTNTSLSTLSLFKPKASNEINLHGVFDFDWNKPASSFAGRAKLDATNINGRLAWAGAAMQASYNFDLDVDALDWDRYTTGSAHAKAPKPAAPNAGPVFDLSAIRALRAKGVARVGVLKASGVTAKNVTLDVQ